MTIWGTFRARRFLLSGAVALLVLVACARDSESRIRAHLDQWFFVGTSLYFKSLPQCTAAIFRLTTERPKPSFPVYGDPDVAKAAFSDIGLTALQFERLSPHQIIEGLKERGSQVLGNRALQAGSLAKPCFTGKAGKMFFAALTQKGATIGYESRNEALIILDPYQMALFYVAGDIW